MYQPPPNTNPYRFAQAIYGDTTCPDIPNNFNRSCSTLGDANTAFFATNDPNTITSPITRYSVNGRNQHHNAQNLNDTSMSSTLAGNYNQTYQSQSFYQNPARGGGGGGTSLNSPLPDSLLAIMNNDTQNNYYGYKKHNYDHNITLCQSPIVAGDYGYQVGSSMTTPMNPFSAKVGKALYGLPFLSRSKSSLSYGMTNHVADQYSEQPNYSKQSYRATQKYTNNSNKMMKASKI